MRGLDYANPQHCFNNGNTYTAIQNGVLIGIVGYYKTLTINNTEITYDNYGNQELICIPISKGDTISISSGVKTLNLFNYL